VKANALVTGGDDGCSPYFGHGSSVDHFNANSGSPPCPTQCGNSNYFRSIENDKYRIPTMEYREVFRGSSNFQRILQQSLVQNGPVPFGIYANGPFMGYRSGVFQGDRTAQANHEVVAIGYGAQPQAYVLGLNSWGNTWGEQGSFKLTYCGVTDFTLTSFSAPTNLPSPLVAGGASTGGAGGAVATTGATLTPTTSTGGGSTAGGSMPWAIASGPCTRDDTTGCIMSPSWSAAGSTQYGHNQKCDITVQSTSPGLEVIDFNTEAGYDKLMVNGAEFRGNQQGTVPTANMVWTSDYSVANRGWKICPEASQV